jgi:hypothetical protein
MDGVRIQKLRHLGHLSLMLSMGQQCDEEPPNEGDILELPAGGTFTVELAHNRGQTTLSFDGMYTSKWPGGGVRRFTCTSSVITIDKCPRRMTRLCCQPRMASIALSMVLCIHLTNLRLPARLLPYPTSPTFPRSLLKILQCLRSLASGCSIPSKK